MTTRRLKVCLVASYDLVEEGGVKRHALHLAEELRRLGDEADIIGPYSGTAKLERGTYGFRGVVNIRSNGSDNRMGIFVCPHLVRRFLVEGRYDVVHVMEPIVPSLPVWATWFAGSSARVATFHAFSEQEALASRLTRLLLGRPHLRLFHRGIAVSPAAARFARHAWRRPLTVIPNGVDTGIFQPNLGEASLARVGPIRLLFVGHWRDPRKGLATLVAAYSSLRDRGLALSLDVVGEGDASRRPQTNAPGITYYGPIASETELADRYRACDIFVAPSTGMESFGIVLLEAMACARAIVCSDIEGYRYVAAPGGARLVPPDSVEALAHAISELAVSERERRRMGEVNRRAALEFDWSRIAARVRQEYLQALSASGRLPRPAPMEEHLSPAPALEPAGRRCASASVP